MTTPAPTETDEPSPAPKPQVLIFVVWGIMIAMLAGGIAVGITAGVDRRGLNWIGLLAAVVAFLCTLFRVVRLWNRGKLSDLRGVDVAEIGLSAFLYGVALYIFLAGM